MSVENSNIAAQQAPESLDELIKFVEFVRDSENELFVQITGNSVDVVKQLADHFKVNFFDTSDMKVDMNPFAIFYITGEKEILKRAQTFKSKVIIYARRPIHHHH